MLTAGPETDRRVAEAIGLTWVENIFHYPDLTHCGAYVGKPSCDTWRSSRFSTDLNDAFWAADKINMSFQVGRNSFKEGPRYFIASIQVQIFDMQSRWFDTPALAICAAILKLKGAE